MRQHHPSSRVTRREAIRLLGAGAATFAAACREPVEPTASSVVAESAVVAPDRPIIRTILRDIAPEELGDGAILMHEHLSATSPYPYEPPRDIPPTLHR